jgi:hypothetical protein
MRPFIRDAYQWQQQHTQFHITKSYSRRESTFLFVTSRCFSSVQVFCVKGIFYGMRAWCDPSCCCCRLPRREKLKQTGWRRKERCWLHDVNSPGIRDHHVAPLEISFLCRHCLARPYRFVRQFFQQCAPV